MHQVPLSVGRLDELSMTGLVELACDRRGIPRREQRLRVRDVRAPEVTGTRHPDPVVPPRPTFGEHEVVPAVPPVQVGTFAELLHVVLRYVDHPRPSDGHSGQWIELLQVDPGKPTVPAPVVPAQADDVTAPIGSVEERRVEPPRVQVHRCRPRPV